MQQPSCTSQALSITFAHQEAAPKWQVWDGRMWACGQDRMSCALSLTVPCLLQRRQEARVCIRGAVPRHFSLHRGGQVRKPGLQVRCAAGVQVPRFRTSLLHAAALTSQCVHTHALLADQCPTSVTLAPAHGACKSHLVKSLHSGGCIPASIFWPDLSQVERHLICACSFGMEAIPGNSTVSAQVANRRQPRARAAAVIQPRHALAAAGADAPPSRFMLSLFVHAVVSSCIDFHVVTNDTSVKTCHASRAVLGTMLKRSSC